MDIYGSTTLLKLLDKFEAASNPEELLSHLQIFLLPLLNLEGLSLWRHCKDNRWRCSAALPSMPRNNTVEYQPSSPAQFICLPSKTLGSKENVAVKPTAFSHSIILNVKKEHKGELIVLTPAPNEVISEHVSSQLEQLHFIFKIAIQKLDKLGDDPSLRDKSPTNSITSQQRLKLFAEMASDWFWETDSELRYFYLSATESDAQASRYQHFIGKTPMEVRSVVEKENLKKWGHWLHMINQRLPLHEFEYEVLDAQGQPFWIAISGQPQFDQQGQFLGYIGTGRDISFSKQREADLTKAREKAELASAAKSHFLAVMSHEIRTPMNAILGMLELFEDTSPSDKQLELIEFMRSSANLLQGVITDTLDFAKIESGKLTLQPSTINLYSLLKNLVKQFETQALKQELDFVYEMTEQVPQLVVCDGLRLSQVLLNLLGNAFKFTPSGQITLNVSSNDCQLIFRIKDTGVGIPKHRLESLFEPFTQMESENQARQQGVGLGLSITKRLLTLMNGSIDCHSEVGVFSEFIVFIPLQKAPSLTSQLTESVAGSSAREKKLHVLVAEDNVANQFVIQAILEKQNYQVTLVENGELAVEQAGQVSFDLVLMDMMMPKMNGTTAAELIRKQFSPSQLPIIALTANAGIEDRARCLQSGMNEVLTKPIDTQLLLKKIKQFTSIE